MRISGFGHGLYGFAVAGLAVLCLVYGDFAPIVEPFPARLPEVWSHGLEAMLLAASVGLLFARTALFSTIIVGAYGLVWTLARARPVLLKPRIVGTWYGLGEALGLHCLAHGFSMRCYAAMTRPRRQ